MILGITLLLALGLEGLYRVQAAVRTRLRGTRAESFHPNAGQPWWAHWVETEGAVNGPSRYDPYRGWWALPYQSRWVNVDSAGRRVTVPAPAAGAITRRVVLLGGSVMWGYTVPDSLTIPSLIASSLQQRGPLHTEVLNLAQPSYNSTQGLNTLVLALRAGYRPDVVISLDGNNDVLAAVTDGHPGAAFGEQDLARRSAVGSRGFWPNVAGLLRYSALARRLSQMGTTRPDRNDGAGAAPGCDSIAQYYRNVVSSAEGLGRQYGFAVHYAWQPHWATTGKTLSAFESTIRAQDGFPALLRSCTGLVDSLMRGDSAFLSLTPIFDRDSATIFIDEFGHMTPLGHERVASELVRLIP